jgi:hypothetical protein
MLYMAFQFRNQIVHQLRRFGFDYGQVVAHYHGSLEVVVDCASRSAPLLSILHGKDMVTAANNAIAYDRGRRMTINSWLLSPIALKVIVEM